MSDDEIIAICDGIRYKDWSLLFTHRHAQLAGPVVYWRWRAPCVKSGMMAWQHGAPWGVRRDIDEEGLIRLAFAAAQRCEMHECAENFTYRRCRVFDPHLPVLRDAAA